MGYIPPPSPPMADNVMMIQGSSHYIERFEYSPMGQIPPPPAPLPRMTRGGRRQLVKADPSELWQPESELWQVPAGIGVGSLLAAIPAVALLGGWGMLFVLAGFLGIFIAYLLPSGPQVSVTDMSPQARFARDEIDQLELEQEIDRQLAAGKSGFESMETQVRWNAIDEVTRLKQDIAKRERDFTEYTYEDLYREKLIMDVMEYHMVDRKFAERYVDDRMAVKPVKKPVPVYNHQQRILPAGFIKELSAQSEQPPEIFIPTDILPPVRP